MDSLLNSKSIVTITVTSAIVISDSTNSIAQSAKSSTSTRAVAAASKNRPASAGLKWCQRLGA